MIISLVVWWLIGALPPGLVELATVGLTLLMLVIDALEVLAVTQAGVEPPTSTGVFVVMSFLFFSTLRPWIRIRLDRSTPNMKMDAAGLASEEVKVPEVVNVNGGRARPQGEVWSATCFEPLGVGAKARIARTDGMTATIEPLSL